MSDRIKELLEKKRRQARGESPEGSQEGDQDRLAYEDSSPLSRMMKKMQAPSQPSQDADLKQTNKNGGEDKIYENSQREEAEDQAEEGISQRPEYPGSQSTLPDLLSSMISRRKEALQETVHLKVGQTDKPEKRIREANPLSEMVRKFKKSQWYKRREKRVDPKEMLTKARPKLLKLNDEQARDVARAYGTFGIEVDPAKIIEISREGYSPHVARELGIDYLGNNIVIIAPEQKRCDLVRENHSYLDQILKMVFERAEPIVQSFTPHEALVGSINHNIMDVIKKGERRFTVDVTLDTPEKEVKRIRRVKKIIDSIVDKDPNNIMKSKVRQRMESLVKPLYDKYKNLNRIMTPEVFPVKIDMDLFVADIGSKQMYCFQDGKTVIIYFDSKNELQPFENESLRLVNGYDKAALLDALYDSDMIIFDIGTVRDHLVELAEQTFHKEGKDPEDFATFVEYLKDTEAFEAKKESPEYNAVRKVLEDLQDPEVSVPEYFKSLDPELRMKLIDPRIHHKMVYEILAKSDPEDYFKAYEHHEDIFKEFFRVMTDEERESVLLSVMDKIHFVDQYNRSLNTWIKENYPAMCGKIGIRFVEG